MLGERYQSHRSATLAVKDLKDHLQCTLSNIVHYTFLKPFHLLRGIIYYMLQLCIHSLFLVS